MTRLLKETPLLQRVDGACEIQSSYANSQVQKAGATIAVATLHGVWHHLVVILKQTIQVGKEITKRIFKCPQRTPHSGHFYNFIDFFFSSHLLK